MQQQEQEFTSLNYASDECGAVVVEVTAEASQVVSSASNVLIDREDLLWISGSLPQHVVVQLGPHPPIRYLGWHVWHDYLTNPKVVEIHTGVIGSCLNPVMTCTALPGGGTQLWELTDPIPESHSYVKFRITSTFGADTTYMNRIFLFSEHPGPNFLSKAPVMEEGMRSPGSPLRMTNLLRDLDDEIRMLHPLRNVSPPRQQLLFNANNSSSDGHNIGPIPLPSETRSPRQIPVPTQSRSPQSMQRPQSTNSYSNPTSPHQGGLPSYNHNQNVGGGGGGGGGNRDKATEGRLQNLEQAMVQLVRHMDTQSKDIASLRHLLEGGALTAPVNPSSSSWAVQQQQRTGSPQSHHGSLDHQHRSQSGSNGANPFPTDALRHYVEEALAPRLSKYQKRTEDRVMQRLDDHFQQLMRSVEGAVDERVKRYLHDIAMDIEHPYHHHFQHIVPSHQPKAHQHTTATAGSGSASRRREEEQYSVEKAQRRSYSGKRKEVPSTHFGAKDIRR